MIYATSILLFVSAILAIGKYDYEKYLISDGYRDIIISAINECENDEEYFANYILTKNHTSMGRERTNDPTCGTCQQHIYKDVLRDFDGEGGLERALYDCCTGKKAKAKYATYVAGKIVSQQDVTKRIPSKINTLLKEIGRLLNLTEKEDYRTHEVIE